MVKDLLNIEEEAAVIRLDKYLKKNPEAMKSQLDLELRMKHLTNPEERLAFLLNEIEIECEKLTNFLKEK